MFNFVLCPQISACAQPRLIRKLGDDQVGAIVNDLINDLRGIAIDRDLRMAEVLAR